MQSSRCSGIGNIRADNRCVMMRMITRRKGGKGNQDNSENSNSSHDSGVSESGHEVAQHYLKFVDDEAEAKVANSSGDIRDEAFPTPISLTMNLSGTVSVPKGIGN